MSRVSRFCDRDAARAPILREMDVLHDDLGRPLRSLRVSVTDRCNLRCAYCMPEQGYRWLERERLLHFGEIATLVDAFCSLGLEAVRITGGEPLMRRELPRLVEQLARRPALREIAMTTNGMLLAEHAEELALAGLRRVTVSLDTLDERTFERIARRRGLPDVLAGIAAATRLWPGRVKLDTVVLRDVNDAEVTGLLEFARERGIEARFIEYMDVGGATHWSPEKVVSRDEILRRIEHRHGPIEELRERSSAPAERFRLGDGTVFGIVASTTAPFCARCDRSRLTADGHWYLCLYARLGLDLRALLRAGASTEEVARRLAKAWRARRERGAEERLAGRERGPYADSNALREDPRLEMHTRGG